MVEFLDPKDFELHQRLDNVMILVPSYKQPHPLTRQCVDNLTSLGADVQASWGCSDPALHRCIMAGRAWEVLRRDEGKYEFVLWFDDDMICRPNTVQFMIACSLLTGVAISAYYCKRGQSSCLALSRMPGEPLEFALADKSGASRLIQLEPVIGGMGCLLIPRHQFLKHVQSVPNVTKFRDDGSRSDMPGICSSGFCPDDTGLLGWLSEDLVYGQSLWHWANGVYAAPVVCAHISEMPLLPLPGARWLNDHSAEGTEVRMSGRELKKENEP